MNNEILELVQFNPSHQINYLRSLMVMNTMMPLTIQGALNMDIPLSDIVANSTAVMQQYLTSLPPLHLSFYSNFQEGVVQTISGLRGAQPYIWIKIINREPHLPLIGMVELFSLLASEGPSMIPPSQLNYLVYFHGLRVSFFVKCNVPVVGGASTSMKAISVNFSANGGSQIVTGTPDLLNLTNPYHAMKIDHTLKYITTVDPTDLVSLFSIMSP